MVNRDGFSRRSDGLRNGCDIRLVKSHLQRSPRAQQWENHYCTCNRVALEWSWSGLESLMFNEARMRFHGSIDQLNHAQDGTDYSVQKESSEEVEIQMAAYLRKPAKEVTRNRG